MLEQSPVNLRKHSLTVIEQAEDEDCSQSTLLVPKPKSQRIKGGMHTNIEAALVNLSQPTSTIKMTSEEDKLEELSKFTLSVDQDP